MYEYIEREAAQGAVMKRKWEVGSDGAMAMEILCTLPAADVEPVRHGRWIQTRITRYNGDKPYTQFAHNCSLCNWLNKKKKGWNTKFCPNCGTKMDREAE